MAHRPLDAVIRHIRKVAGVPLNSRESDPELLQRFVDDQDATAFAALVQRHGPLVRSVCRRLLRHEADVDDAFQATFLVLFRKAGTIRRRPSLASWLYGVAFRIARKAKSQSCQRQAHEQRVIGASPAEPWREAAWREICAVLDEELQGLSEKYRASLVLCYLEGRTRDEAAHQLGWSLRTLQRRLERGREILRARLMRRGLTLSAGLLATALSEHVTAAALPAGLVNSTVKAILLYGAGKTAAAGLISGQGAALAKGVLTAMFLRKMTTVATLVVALGVTGTGTGLWTYQTVAAQRADAPDKKAAARAAAACEELQSFLRVPSQHDGIVRVIGTEIKEGDKVPPEQTITIKINGEVRKYRRLKKGDKVEEGQLLARLDDDLARADVAIQIAKVRAAKAEKVSSEKTRDEAQQRYETQKKLLRAGNNGTSGTTAEDLRGALLQVIRYTEETVSKEEAIKVAEQELNKARKVLEMYEIRSPSRGVIKAIYRRPGEAVKALETVFLIQVPEE
jgi:RNA polymerase sigma factor (sigma-70 family)